MKYSLSITGKHITEEQIWTSVGTDRAGNTLLTNTAQYTKDATLSIDKNLNVVAGYEFIFNPGNTITVKQIG